MLLVRKLIACSVEITVHLTQLGSNALRCYRGHPRFVHFCVGDETLAYG